MNNEELVKSFMQKVWSEKDFDSITNYVSPAYTIYKDPSDPWEGRTLNFEEFAMRLDYSFDSFPDIHFEIQTAISDEDDIAITWIMTGTNSGKNGSFPPTNKTIITKGSTIFHFNDDKICGYTQVADMTKIRNLPIFLNPGAYKIEKCDPVNTVITS